MFLFIWLRNKKKSKVMMTKICLIYNDSNVLCYRKLIQIVSWSISQKIDYLHLKLIILTMYVYIFFYPRRKNDEVHHIPRLDERI